MARRGRVVARQTKAVSPRGCMHPMQHCLHAAVLTWGPTPGPQTIYFSYICIYITAMQPAKLHKYICIHKQILSIDVNDVHLHICLWSKFRMCVSLCLCLSFYSFLLSLPISYSFPLTVPLPFLPPFPSSPYLSSYSSRISLAPQNISCRHTLTA